MSASNALFLPCPPPPGRIAAGVDVGGTTAKPAVADETGRVLVLEPVPTRDRAPEEVLDDVAAELLAAADGRVPDSCGVGFPGIVRRGTEVAGSPNMPRWTGFDLASGFLGRLARGGAPAPRFRAVNDANAAALAESRMGGERAVDDLLFLTLGTGVGAGIVIGGKILTGAGGFAGEGGHVTVDPEGEPCGCGRRGCLETRFSELGLSRAAARAGLGAPTAKELFDRAKSGDAAALDVLDAGLDALAIGISGMCALLDPEEVVLGGGISKAGNFLLERLHPHLRERIRYPGYELPRVRLASLGSEAGLLGAMIAARTP